MKKREQGFSYFIKLISSYRRKDLRGEFVMFGFHQIKNFIYLAVFLVGFSFSSFALGNFELSGHFGMKLGSQLNLDEVIQDTEDWGVNQKNRPWHFGADLFYRQMMEGGSLGIGFRYRLAFTGQKDFEGTGDSSRGGEDDDDKYKFSHHRVALLANYRFHINQFFVGPILGIDVWKSLKYTDTNEENDNTTTYELSSNQFLWNQISGQIGLEIGYKITNNFLVKLEGGYDLSGFSGLKCKTGEDLADDCDDDVLKPKGTGDEDADKTKTFKLSGFYAALGIGWFFG